MRIIIVIAKKKKSKAGSEGGRGASRVRASGRKWKRNQSKTREGKKNRGGKKPKKNGGRNPPGGNPGGKIQEGFEGKVKNLEDRVRHDYGERLSRRVEHQAGDFIFIEPGVPHEVYNMSQTDPVGPLSSDRVRTSGTESSPTTLLTPDFEKFFGVRSKECSPRAHQAPVVALPTSTI